MAPNTANELKEWIKPEKGMGWAQIAHVASNNAEAHLTQQGVTDENLKKIASATAIGTVIAQNALYGSGLINQAPKAEMVADAVIQKDNEREDIWALRVARGTAKGLKAGAQANRLVVQEAIRESLKKDGKQWHDVIKVGAMDGFWGAETKMEKEGYRDKTFRKGMMTSWEQDRGLWRALIRESNRESLQEDAGLWEERMKQGALGALATRPV